MSFSALNFKPYDKGSLRGFFDLRYHGLTIRGCRLMESNGGLWIALPQKEIDQDGERKWIDQLFLTPPEAEHVRRAVILDLQAQGHIGAPPPKRPARQPARLPEQDDLSEHRTPAEDLQDDIPF